MIQIPQQHPNTMHERGCQRPQIANACNFASNYSARKLSGLSSLAVPELDDSPIASGEAATCADDSLFREVGIPEIS